LSLTTTITHSLYKQYYIMGAASCSIKHLSKQLTSILTVVKSDTRCVMIMIPDFIEHQI
jgi:hypothetical protein